MTKSRFFVFVSIFIPVSLLVVVTLVLYPKPDVDVAVPVVSADNVLVPINVNGAVQSVPLTQVLKFMECRLIAATASSTLPDECK